MLYTVAYTSASPWNYAWIVWPNLHLFNELFANKFVRELSVYSGSNRISDNAEETSRYLFLFEFDFGRSDPLHLGL